MNKSLDNQMFRQQALTIEYKINNANVYFILFSLMLCSLLVRIFLFIQPQIISNDSVFYIMVAKSIESGHQYHSSDLSFFSIYPFFLVIMFKCVNNWELAGRLLSLGFGTLAVVPLFLLFSRMLSRKIALIAAILYIIGPRFMEYSTDILREPTFWCISLCALWCALKGIDEKKLPYLLLSSLITVLSFGIRIEGIGIFLVIVSWIIFNKNRLSAKETAGYILIISFYGPAIVFLSCFILNFQLSSEIIKMAWDNKLFPLLQGVKSSGVITDNLNSISLYTRSLLELARDHKYFLFSVEIIFKTFKSITLLPTIFLLAGFFLRRIIPFSRREGYLIIWIAVFFIVSIFYMRGTHYFSTRHGLLLGIPALPWMAIGFLELGNAFRILVGRHLNRLPKLAPILMFLLLAIVLGQAFITGRPDDKIDLKMTGLELKNKGYAKSKMYIQQGLQRLAFYADSDSIVMPDNIKARDIPELMKDVKATILVVDLDSINSLIPKFQSDLQLSKFDRIPAAMKSRKSHYTLIIYKLKDS